MKNRDVWQNWILTGLVLVAGGLWSSPALSAESYPMVCRGGPSMSMRLTFMYPGENVDVKVFFVAARSAANRSQPGPGECAWLDRPLNAKEPRILKFRENHPITTLSLTADGPIDGFPGGSLLPGQMVWDNRREKTKYIYRALTRGEIFYIHARNKGSYFEVTRFGP
jgi:hypothetical protein